MKQIKFLIANIFKFIKINTILGSLILSSFSYAESKGTAQRDENGKLYSESTYNFKGSVQDADAMSIITAYAIGALGTKLLLYKNWTADMYVAAGGSAVFFACAVMNIIKSKEAVGDISVRVKNYYDGTATDSKNVEYIKALRESFEEQRKSGERLKTCMNIAKYAFYGAGVIALGLKLRKESQKFNCYGATEHALEQMTGVCASEKTTGKVDPSCELCLARMRNLQREIGVRDGQMESAVGTVDSSAEQAFVKKPTLKATAEMSTPCLGTSGDTFRGIIATACSSYIAEGELDLAWGKTVTISKNDMINNFPYMLFTNNKKDVSGLKKIVSRIFDLFIPSANANYTEMLGLVGGAATSFITSYYVTGLYIDKYIWSSTGRVIAWGALGVFVGMAISTLEKRIGDVEKSIEKIDAILAEMNKLSKGIKSSNTTITTVQLNNLLMNDLGSTTLPSGEKFSCLTSNANNNCADVASINNANKLSISNMPEAITSFSSSLGSTISSLGGNDKLSGSKLSNLADQANNKAIQKHLKDQQKSLNELMRSKGKGFIDFNKEQEKFGNGLIKTINSSLDKTPDKGKSLALALLGGEVPKITDKDSLSKAGGQLVKGIIRPIQNQKSESKEEEKKNDDFKLLGEDKDNGNVLANGMREGSSNDKYDIKENDINKDNGESIFNIISKRYINSGYPKLLEEVK